MAQINKPIAVISGANKGIGFETARELIKKGYFVFIGSRDIARGEKARDEIGAQDSLVIQLDVSNQESINNAVVEILKHTDSIDVLVNNSGIGKASDRASKSDINDIKSTFDVNFYGPILLTQALIPLLRKGKEKNIVNVSSDLGSIGMNAYPEYKLFNNCYFGYSMSKTALNAFTVHLANELMSEGFKVNAVSPGYTRTDMNSGTGDKSANQAGQFVARIASLPPGNIPTASYFHEGGVLPW
ncbi:hypothetical protein CYY_008849 [Polysphondylium violaceum]|uniref:Uncharacterized protein n=1 Tax=Polysphondylium violaceum TaxID=133409 RepID=A0A8J4V0Y2_9MYCE|nr:hypothetical protein CYY_008849 [Polysphondylium violaceum]